MSTTNSTAGSVTRRLRDDTARAVLLHVWDLPPDVAVTGSDLIAATGLSRATVHDVCDELIDRGWLRELANERSTGTYTKGRPARRYGFDTRAGAVVGIDAGEHRISARVTDLRGAPLAAVERVVDQAAGRTPVAHRIAALEEVLREAFAAAGSPRVLAVSVGVPAPVDVDGRTLGTDNPFWEFTNPDLTGVLGDRFGWPVLVENDANLAALAEGWCGAGAGLAHQVTVLAGERIGAGVVDDGRLLRGARGGVGEMRYLDIVEGVGSPEGLGKVLRDLGGTQEAADVLAAAGTGGRGATAPLEIAGLRLTRIVVTLVSLVDPERVILAGGAASPAIVAVVNRELPSFLHLPRPLVVASTLGRDVVVLGALRRALDHVRAEALSLRLD